MKVCTSYQVSFILANNVSSPVPESTPQSSQCSDGVHGYSEVVPGVKGKAPRTTDNNEGTREGKVSTNHDVSYFCQVATHFAEIDAGRLHKR